VDEKLLGFDAREHPDPAFRPPRQFLLRHDISQLLTIDTMLWPGISLQRPHWIGPNDPLWESLPQLERAAADVSCMIIAVTWHAETDFASEPQGQFGPHADPVDPPVRDSTWTFLGYDVTDPGISGLSNCGYTAEEQPQLEARFARRLNANHLFVEPEPAFAFRAIANRRVKEHAPFFVMGLWRVR
jgi:hypothetical protein